MARLQGIEDPRRGYGLEYQYIDVKDEYRDGMINGYILHLHIINWIASAKFSHQTPLSPPLADVRIERMFSIIVMSLVCYMSTDVSLVKLKHYIFVLADHTRLGVTVLDGDPHHTGLLKFALTKENFADTLVLLVVSMSQPWSILESLQKWTQILQDHINRLKIPPEQMYEYEQSCK